MNKNGFTLIELLAVIAILAIILLIAVPMILSTISTSRNNTLNASAKMIWDAAEKCVAMNTIDPANCANPATHATAAGFSNETSFPTGNWMALANVNFGGRYRVTWGANNKDIISVIVTNETSSGLITAITPRCTITSKSQTTCA